MTEIEQYQEEIASLKRIIEMKDMGAARQDQVLLELRTEVDKLKGDIVIMVKKAADQNLDGYRELGATAANAENEAMALRAELKALKEELVIAKEQALVANNALSDLKVRFPWHRTGGNLPDVPVLQDRYDKLLADLSKMSIELEAAQKGVTPEKADSGIPAQMVQAIIVAATRAIAKVHDAYTKERNRANEAQAQLNQLTQIVMVNQNTFLELVGRHEVLDTNYEKLNRAYHELHDQYEECKVEGLKRKEMLAARIKQCQSLEAEIAHWMTKED